MLTLIERGEEGLQQARAAVERAERTMPLSLSLIHISEPTRPY